MLEGSGYLEAFESLVLVVVVFEVESDFLYFLFSLRFKFLEFSGSTCLSREALLLFCSFAFLTTSCNSDRRKGNKDGKRRNHKKNTLDLESVIVF